MDMTTIERLRAAWNSYVFGRAGMAEGHGMEVRSEQDTFEALTAALQAFMAEWDSSAMIDLGERERASIATALSYWRTEASEGRGGAKRTLRALLGRGQRPLTNGMTDQLIGRLSQER